MRLAVLGLGSAGSRHARNLLALGHEVVGFDPSGRPPPDAVARAASEREAIRSADAVVVASPSVFHAEQALAALGEGRSVLVEKPLATTTVDAVAIDAAAADAGVVCAVAMNLRFLPALTTLKRILAENRLGKPLLAEACFGYDLRRWRPESDYRESYSARSELGGGIVLDAIHELDYVSWLLGDVVSVTAETGHVSDLEIDVEDVALALLRFCSGALASVSVNFFEPAYRRGCALVGGDAVARWTWGTDTIALHGPDGAEERLHVPTNISQTYEAVARDFVEAVETGREPRTSCGDGVAAVRLADAVKRAAAGGVRISL